LMSSSPHQTNIGWRDVSIIWTDVLRLCGQFSAGPSGVFPQSISRIRCAISLEPENRWFEESIQLLTPKGVESIPLIELMSQQIGLPIRQALSSGVKFPEIRQEIKVGRFEVPLWGYADLDLAVGPAALETLSTLAGVVVQYDVQYVLTRRAEGSC